MLMHEHAIIALAGIGVLALVCQWVAWWVKLPAILFLLLVGIVAGPVLGWLEPDALFGDLLLPLVSLSVAVILFEGSLTLRVEDIRGLERVVRRLITTGLVVTWVITAVAVHILLDFPWELSFLFGAVTVVTGPTVIVPILRTVRPQARVANILRWEGIVIDPIGALLAVLVFEFIISGRGGVALGHTVIVFAQVLAAGILVGIAVGFGLGLVLRRHLLPEFLHNVAALTLVFAAFAIANAVQEESGLLAVTVMGLWLANMPRVNVTNILDFKESLSVLLISGLFIILAARIDPAQFQALGWAGLGVFLAIQFVARPAKVAVATWGSSLPWRERTLLAWIAPRGIVAAAVAAVFALRLQEQGAVHAELLVPLTFLVIVGTVLLQSVTARLLARGLGIAEPEPKGFLIVGANPVARAVGKALENQGFRTLLTDTNWDNVRAARMAGLASYYGNAVSEHADRHLDLVGIGRMLGLSPQRELNALAAMRYRTEFGRESVFTLPASAEKEPAEKAEVPETQRAQTAFGEDISYTKLASLLSQGGEIHETPLTEDFDFDAYQAQYGRKAIPLFAVTPRGRLRLFTAASEFTPEAGWTVVGLIQQEALESATQSDSAEASASADASSDD